MDELKRYIRQHADELDLDEPRPQVWDRISQQAAVKKTNVVVMITRWAAAACVLVLAGIGIWHLAGTSGEPTQTAPVAVVTREEKPVTVVPETGIDKVTAVPVTEPRTSATTRLTAEPKQQSRQQAESLVRTANMRALTDIENSFTQVINLQRARVSTTPMYAETPAYFDDFKLQLKQMEKDEKNVKADITRRGLNDALLDQLINLYQQKLNILKQLQFEMNKTNNRFKQNSNPVDTTRTYFLNI